MSRRMQGFGSRHIFALQEMVWSVLFGSEIVLSIYCQSTRSHSKRRNAGSPHLCLSLSLSYHPFPRSPHDACRGKVGHHTVGALCNAIFTFIYDELSDETSELL